MNRHISKAAVHRDGLFPSTNEERHFIRELKVFSPNCMMPDPTCLMRAVSNLMESSATETFLSQQYSEATKL